MFLEMDKMTILKCPICGKDLKPKYGILTCECGWAEPTAHKPLAKACKSAAR